MASVLTATNDMSRNEWLKARRRGIGGSDAAAIAGLSPWKSPLAVYLEKIGELQDDMQSEAAYWGTTLEDVVAKEFAQRTGLKIHRRNAMLQHQKYPYMLANIDRYVLDPDRGRGVLECKTTSAYNAKAWDGDKIPDHYMIQVQHYLAVTGLQYGYIAVLIGGQRFLHQLVERNEEIIQYLTQIEGEFWKLVESRTPPPVDGSQAATDLLDMLYPADEAKPEQMMMPPTAMNLIAEYEQAKAEAKAASERADEAANKLKAILGEYEIGIADDREIRWKQITSNRVDPKSLKAKYPAIYAEMVKESHYRKFEVR
jgi:putative phage-type endonuclease